METLQEFLNEAKPLFAAVDGFANEYNASMLAQADHFCYKCGSREEYETLKAMLEMYATDFCHTAKISGRDITTMRLGVGVTTRFGPCSVLELSDQKPDNSQVSGFDHVEIFPVARTYENLLAALTARGAAFTQVGRPHHTTHDHKLPGGFTLRLTQGPLIEKIKEETRQAG